MNTETICPCVHRYYVGGVWLTGGQFSHPKNAMMPGEAWVWDDVQQAFVNGNEMITLDDGKHTATLQAEVDAHLGRDRTLDIFRPMETLSGEPARFVGVIRNPNAPLVVAVDIGGEETIHNYTVDGYFYPDRRACRLNLRNKEGK